MTGAGMPPVTPAEALAELQAGNVRFVTGTRVHPNQDAEHRTALAGVDIHARRTVEVLRDRQPLVTAVAAGRCDVVGMPYQLAAGRALVLRP